MLGSASVVTFVATTDEVRARGFYESVLGLELRASEPQALVFSMREALLRVTVLPEHAPAPFTVLGWDVPDIGAAVAELGERGVIFEHFEGMPQDGRGVCTFPGGDKVAWFKDPDGNVLSVSQPAQPTATA